MERRIFYHSFRGGSATAHAILSDIHGNTPALRALLNDIDRQNCSELVVLGDTVAGFDQNGCMDLLASRSMIRCIKGNAEHYAQVSSSKDISDPVDPSSLRWIRVFSWWRELISEKYLNEISTLPDDFVCTGACFIHDSPVDNPYLNRSITIDPFYHSEGISEELREDEETVIRSFLAERGCAVLFCGHTHIPFIKRLDDIVICNVGSVGKPYDGNPNPSWVKWDGDDGFEIRRVSYNIEEAVEEYRKINRDNSKRCERFARSLRNGTHRRGPS